MKEKIVPIILLIVIVPLFVIGIIESKNNMNGITIEDIEMTSRNNSSIDDNWFAAKDSKGKIGAILFYDEEKLDHSFSVYLADSKKSNRYFFRHGGSLHTIEEGVHSIFYEGYGTVMFSLNRDHIAKITFKNESEGIIIDPNTPFVIILPLDDELMGLFNNEGDEILLDEVVFYFSN